MATLLTALFYLWLVITILLVAMWFLRRQDLLRGPDDDELIDVGMEPDRDRPTPELEVKTGPEPADQEVAAPGTGEEPGLTTRPKKVERRRKPRAKKLSPPEPPTPEPIPAGTGSSVLDLLDGIALPYDLTPTTGCIAEPDRHAIFLSSHGDAEAVGTAFADELARLGYRIEPDGLDQARATRDDQVLMLKISPDAGTRGSGDHRRYPTAGDNDVAIEVWTGQDSPPALNAV